MAETMHVDRCRTCDASLSIGQSLICGDVARSMEPGRAGQIRPWQVAWARLVELAPSMLGTYKLLGTYELAARAGTIDAGKGFASNFTLAGPSAPCGHSSSNIVVVAAGCWPVGQAAGCWLLASSWHA